MKDDTFQICLTVRGQEFGSVARCSLKIWKTPRRVDAAIPLLDSGCNMLAVDLESHAYPTASRCTVKKYYSHRVLQ